jgi:hypothetical protein
VPRIHIIEADMQQRLPSSFDPKRPRRDGVNEFKFLDGGQHAVGHETLGKDAIWFNEATRTIAEVDGYISINTHDGEPHEWHVGEHHHHPSSGHHLRRTAHALLGHLLGLDHSAHSEHATHGISAPGSTMRLARGDIEGILKLYPSNAA